MGKYFENHLNRNQEALKNAHGCPKIEHRLIIFLEVHRFSLNEKTFYVLKNLKT